MEYISLKSTSLCKIIKPISTCILRLQNSPRYGLFKIVIIFKKILVGYVNNIFWVIGTAEILDDFLFSFPVFEHGLLRLSTKPGQIAKITCLHMLLYRPATDNKTLLLLRRGHVFLLNHVISNASIWNCYSLQVKKSRKDKKSHKDIKIWSPWFWLQGTASKVACRPGLVAGAYHKGYKTALKITIRSFKKVFEQLDGYRHFMFKTLL